MSANEQFDPRLPAPPIFGDTPLVPARMVNEFVYCSRLAYLMWTQAERSETGNTVGGQRVQARVNRPNAPLPAPEALEADEGKIVSRSLALSSNMRGLIEATATRPSPQAVVGHPRHVRLGLIEAVNGWFWPHVHARCIRGVRASASLKLGTGHWRRHRHLGIRGVRASASLKPVLVPSCQNSFVRHPRRTRLGLIEARPLARFCVADNSHPRLTRLGLIEAGCPPPLWPPEGRIRGVLRLGLIEARVFSP